MVKMNVSMADYLNVVTPHLQPELVSPEVLSHIQTLTQTLPPFSFAGFECRLGAERSRVDFQASLPNRSLNLPEHFLTHPVWQAFQRFYRDWTEPTSFLHQSIDSAIVEFDLVEQPLQVPIPCLLLVLNEETVCGTQPLMAVVENLRSQLPNCPVSQKIESNLRLCADSLPKGARIANLAFMLSRQVRALRVVVKGIPPQQLSDYLVQIGWQEPTNTLSPLVDTLSEFVDEIALAFDVGETVSPRIGLECHFLKQPSNEPRWQLLLDYLVETGLCTPVKKNALLTWPGFSQKADNPSLWPQNLNWCDSIFGSQGVSLFSRTIYEIKVVYNPGNPLSAKAYIAFDHNWFSRQELMEHNQQNAPAQTETDVSEYLEKVRSYYDRLNSTIIKYVGTTYQSALLKADLETEPYRQTNLYFAERAGIKSGHRVLDAGCGVCGPSIDIARAIESVSIDAIAISGEQVKTARKLIEEAGLTDRITVGVGDFHHLPFGDEIFDSVFFFESAGYAYDQKRLFSEVYRVLRPGGTLYIKEPFIKEGPLSELEQQAVADANRIYAYNVTPMSQAIEAISAAGFENVTSGDLTDILSTEAFKQAMFEYRYGFPLLTEFGKFHYHQFPAHPEFFGEIKACKPRGEGS